MMHPLSWNATAERRAPKTAEWFLAMSIVAVALIATAVLLGNMLFAVVIGIATAVFLLHLRRAPSAVRAQVDAGGVSFGETHYTYAHLASFWVETRDDRPRLLLRHKKLLSLLTAIPLRDLHPNIIRAALKEFLPEEELVEPLPQKIMEYLGF